jgi:hypothetical protein
MNKIDRTNWIKLIIVFLCVLCVVFHYKIDIFDVDRNSTDFQMKNYEFKKMHQPRSNYNFLNFCSRFIVCSHDEAGGLGHRFGSVVFAVNLALEYGFKMILHDDLWTKYDSSHSSAYVDLKSILNLNEFMSYSTFVGSVGKNTKTYIIRSREEFLNLMLGLGKNEICNITVIVKLATAVGCNGNWCFLEWPGAYQRAKTYFENHHKTSNHSWASTRLVLYHQYFFSKTLIVAWHIRCGDIVVTRSRSFFENINQLFVEANALVHHFFFSERVCSEFSFVSDVFKNSTFLTLSLTDTVLYLQTADVLVHMGSSLTPAAYISGPQTGLFFESQPKELISGAVETYHILSAINFDLDGRLSPVTQGQCNNTACAKQYVQDLYRIRYGKIQTRTQIQEDLEEKYVVQDLNNSNYVMCQNLVKQTALRKGVWIVKLFYNSSDMIYPMEIFRNQMHVELVNIQSIPRLDI